MCKFDVRGDEVLVIYLLLILDVRGDELLVGEIVTAIT